MNLFVFSLSVSWRIPKDWGGKSSPTAWVNSDLLKLCCGQVPPLSCEHSKKYNNKNPLVGFHNMDKRLFSTLIQSTVYFLQRIQFHSTLHKVTNWMCIVCTLCYSTLLFRFAGPTNKSIFHVGLPKYATKVGRSRIDYSVLQCWIIGASRNPPRIIDRIS